MTEDTARLFLPASFVSKLSGRPFHPGDLVRMEVRKGYPVKLP